MKTVKGRSQHKGSLCHVLGSVFNLRIDFGGNGLFQTIYVLMLA